MKKAQLYVKNAIRILHYRQIVIQEVAVVPYVKTKQKQSYMIKYVILIKQ